MSVDYSWAIGHGITVPLESGYDSPELTDVLSEHFGIDADDGIYSFDGSKVWERGVQVSLEGNIMSGDVYAFISDESTFRGGDIREGARVISLPSSQRTHPEIQALHEKLTAAGVEHSEPQWVHCSTIS